MKPASFVARLRARLALWITVVALVVGCGARFTGLSWGSPYLLHIDEMGYNFHAAVRMEYWWAREGWPRPDLISYGALPAYVFLGWKNLVFGSARARAGVQRAHDANEYLATTYSFDPRDANAYYWPDIARAARCFSALLYTLAMLVATRIAWRLWGARAAAFAAVALAMSAGMIQHAHYFTPEAFLTLGEVILLHACVRIADEKRWRDYLYASVAMLIVVATKITSAPVCALVMIASVVSDWTPHASLRANAWRVLLRGRLWISFAIAFVLWWYLNPAALRNPRWYFDPATHFSPIEQVNAYRRGARLPDWAVFFTDKPWHYALSRVLVDCIGRGMQLVSLISLGWVLLRERGAKRLPALLAVLALAPLFATQLQTIRYVVPALPSLLVCAACGLERATRVPRWHAALLALAVVALGEETFRGLAQDSVYLRADTRVAAMRWLRAHRRPDDRIVLEQDIPYGPPLANEWGAGREPGLPLVPVSRLPDGDDAATIDAALEHARFVVLDGWQMRLLDVPEAARRHPGVIAFHRAVQAHGAPPGYHLAATFTSAPSLFGLPVDERHSEILHVAFDHIPLFVYERDTPSAH